nr:conotoxin precursor O1 [Conus ebraeus]DAZ86036.1 TPA_inf: conotoxin precursor O1 [Conus ebraeus]
MKMTYILIVAVLFLTAWTSVTAGDFKNKLKNLSLKARKEVENPKASKLHQKRCVQTGGSCPSTNGCCNGLCNVNRCA